MLYGQTRAEVASKIPLKILVQDLQEQKEARDFESERYAQGMYRNKRTNLKDFVDYVLGDGFKNSERKETEKNRGKTYQEFKTSEGINFILTSDTLQHDGKNIIPQQKIGILS
jgi:hypothetical protein